MKTKQTKDKNDEEKLLSLLHSDGLIGCSIKNYEHRRQQEDMLRDVLRAYSERTVAFIEAGTGTGKSMAYLVPALSWALNHKKATVISTNTINLQEQLINKDIPLILDATGWEVKVVLVKGMSNYLCLRRLRDAVAEASLRDSKDSDELHDIESWACKTKDGSKTDLSFMPSQSVWERISVEGEACAYSQCPHFRECFFIKARRKAADAQIIIVNHHLLFSDLLCRVEEDNFTEAAILPPYRNLILDEAHNVEDVVIEHFAQQVSRWELMRVLGRLSTEQQGVKIGRIVLLREQLARFYKDKNNSDVKSIFSRLDIDLPGQRQNLINTIRETFDELNLFFEDIKEDKQRILKEHFLKKQWKDGVQPLWGRCVDEINKYLQSLRSLEMDIKNLHNETIEEKTMNTRLDINAAMMRLDRYCKTMKAFVEEDDWTNTVRWAEIYRRNNSENITLVLARLDVAKILKENLFDNISTGVLCSATLATNKNFNFIRQRLGVAGQEDHVLENIYESPFNFQKQLLLIVPTDIPEPAHPDFAEIASERILETLRISRGNAFVLFTSYSMLTACYDLLSEQLLEERFNLFKQGDDHRQALIKKFKASKYSVLFGTDSFWEGVDVVGDDLRCVVIVKLPFKVPSDPIQQAQAELISSQGKMPFMEYSLPNAIVKFKQGFGRLIRNKRDRGCIICLDTRLVTKNYGKQFINSLPNCTKMCGPSNAMYQKLKEFYRGRRK